MTDYKSLIIVAERDLAIISVMEPSFPEDFAISNATFHLQQAVEKMLKALLLINGTEYPDTHDISKLSYTAKQNGIQIPESLDIIEDTLTIWGTVCRYDTFLDYKESKYTKAKQACEDLRELVDQSIK